MMIAIWKFAGSLILSGRYLLDILVQTLNGVIGCAILYYGCCKGTYDIGSHGKIRVKTPAF